MKTEEEIIKALKICASLVMRCADCPYNYEEKCATNKQLDAINLIRKQRAEIERLKCETGKLLPKGCPYAVQMEVSNKLETKIRAEAVKEFAERLKKDAYEDIDNIAEEMVGEK